MKKIFMWFVLLVFMVSFTIAGIGCKEEPVMEEVESKPVVEEAGEGITSSGNAELDAWATDIRQSLGGTEIKVAVATFPSSGAFKEMSPMFEELTGIKIVWDEMEEGALGSKLLLEAASGESDYDLVQCAPEWVPMYESSGMLESMEGWLTDEQKTPSWYDQEDIFPASINALSMKEHLWGIPISAETVFQIYRKDIFEEYQLDVPTTYDELLETVKFIDENVPDMDGISMRVRAGWEATYMWSPFIFPFGGKIIDFDDNKPAFDHQETIDSLKYFVELSKYGPVGMESFSWPESLEAFLQGKVGMMVESSAFAPEIENPEKSPVAGKVGYAPMPKGPAGASSGVWAWGLSMMKDSEKKDAVWAFIVFMTSKVMQDEFLSNGGIPFRNSTLEDTEFQKERPYYEPTLETLEQTAILGETGYGVVIMDVRWGPLSEMMGTEISRAVIGEVTPEEACESMQTQALEIWQ